MKADLDDRLIGLISTNSEDTIGYINSLSSLENAVSKLYQAIAEKTVDATARSYFLKISQDSLEHSKLLRGFASWITIPEQAAEPCVKKTVKTLQETIKLTEETQEIAGITGLEFSRMYEKLLSLERCVGDEYQNLMRLNSVRALENVFSGMFNDEEYHQQLLANAKAVCCPNTVEGTSKAPFVKYQNPNAWNDTS